MKLMALTVSGDKVNCAGEHAQHLGFELSDAGITVDRDVELDSVVVPPGLQI